MLQVKDFHKKGSGSKRGTCRSGKIHFLYTAVKAYIGAFGIGNFILYQGTVQRFVQAVSSLAAKMGELRHNNNYLTEVYEFLDLPNSMYKGTLAVEKRDDIDYEVEFKDVSLVGSVK